MENQIIGKTHTLKALRGNKKIKQNKMKGTPLWNTEIKEKEQYILRKKLQ